MHLTKSKWFVFLSISVVLLWALTACGGQDENDPSPAEEIAQQEVVEAENTPTPTMPPPTSTPVPPTPTPLPPTPTPVPTDTPPADSTLEENTADTTMLPDLPLPEDAQGVTYEFSEIIFTSPTEIEALVEFYREALSPDNWEEQVDFSQVDDTFAFVEFDRGDEFIFITIVDFDGAREASIDLSGAPSLAGSAGDGDSTTAATDGSGYTIADWPVPPEAQDVDISGDILSFKVSLQLADVAEFYRPTYEMMDLATGCLDDAADYTSLSCSVSTGDVTLNFFAFEGADDTEVEIDFVNYAPAHPATVQANWAQSTRMACPCRMITPVTRPKAVSSAEGSMYLLPLIWIPCLSSSKLNYPIGAGRWMTPTRVLQRQLCVTAGRMASCL
jgi:hypothetical protein